MSDATPMTNLQIGNLVNHVATRRNLRYAVTMPHQRPKEMEIGDS